MCDRMKVGGNYKEAEGEGAPFPFLLEVSRLLRAEIVNNIHFEGYLHRESLSLI